MCKDISAECCLCCRRIINIESLLGLSDYSTLFWNIYLLKYNTEKGISNRNLRRSFISYRRNGGSHYLFYCYFDERCSDRIQFFDLPIWNFNSRTLHSTWSPLNYPPSISYYFSQEESPLRETIPPEFLLSRMHTWKKVSIINTMLTPCVSYAAYPYNMHTLLRPLVNVLKESSMLSGCLVLY